MTCPVCPETLTVSSRHLLIRLFQHATRCSVGDVPRPGFPRNLREFQRQFATDAACQEYLVACRWPDGFVCPRCGHGRAYRLSATCRWQCVACRRQVSLTAGTILHNTKTPLTVWFWAAYLAVTDKRGISALLLQRQLGLRRYETAWMLLHKLRRAMVNSARQPLYGRRGNRRHLGRWGATGHPRESPIERPQRRYRVGGRGETGRGLESHSDGSHSRFQADHDARLRSATRRARLDGLHRRLEIVRGVAGGGRAAYRPHATHEDGAAPWRFVGGATRGSRDRQPATVADRHVPRGQQGAVAGLSRRVRVPAQPSPSTDGRLSDIVGSRLESSANGLYTDSRRPGPGW